MAAQINLGLMPAWGASERLAALVGRGRALSILLGGETYSAERAMQLGLVEEVLDRNHFDARLNELSASIAAAPPAAVAGIKRSVGAVQPHRHPELAAETIEAFARTWADPAHWEAVDRMEKRRRKKN